MKPEIQLLYNVWKETHMAAIEQTDLPQIKFDEIISSIYSAGPSYHYIIDFFDMSISHMSSSVQEIHGLDPATATLNDILDRIYPEDMEHVSRAETKLFDLFSSIGWSKFTKYKTNYCFRLQTADKGYKLFLHQALVLSMDQNGKIAKSLNIHTDISHITTENNNKISLIGLMGEPSYMDIEISTASDLIKQNCTVFSKREVQIIKLIAEGLTNSEISNKLNIALDTAKNHRRNVLKKAAVKNTVQLVRKCMLEGLV